MSTMFNQIQKRNHRIFLAFVAAALAVVFDQASKFLWGAQAVLNSGISFSWLGSRGIGPNESAPVTPALPFLLTLLFAACVVFLSWQLLEERSRAKAIAYGLFLGGGFSNLLDRWLYAGVRDIWEIPFLSLTNNLADWSIFVAVCLFLFAEIRRSRIFPSST